MGKYKFSGNASLTDLVAALKWVSQNIEAFGGDPNNVTIFGQSGGGDKVRALMGTSAAEGPFEKAIMQKRFARGFGSPTRRRHARWLN